MIPSFNLLTAILNLSGSISKKIFNQNITKNDIEDIITKYDLNRPLEKERIFIVLNENQELHFSAKKGEFSIKNPKITSKEFNNSLVRKICQKLEIESPQESKKIELKNTYKDISKKW